MFALDGDVLLLYLGSPRLFRTMTLDWIAPADRLQALPQYVFARLDELKANARQQGIDLIDLGMGNPDGMAHPDVIAAAKEALDIPLNHGYPPFEGTIRFRQAIAKWYHRRYGVELDPQKEALPLLGSKEGLAHLALTYLNPGDIAIVPSPAYPVHFRGPAIAGADIYTTVLTEEQNWLIDLSSIPEEVARKAKILFFNYPSNPTAATAPREFFEEIVAFAKKYQILLVHDLCYAELAFDGYQPTSLLEIEGARDIGVEFHTMSKTYNMAGWRVGFVVGNSQIIQGLRTLKTNLDYGIFTALQAGAEAALNLPDTYVTTVQERYRSRRDLLIDRFNQLGWNLKPTQATMYLWVPCPPGIGSTEFALSVMEKTGVVFTPGNAFGIGGEGYIRVSLIADADRLNEAMDRLSKAGIYYN
jgi:LL-diaminopimelate aminotransferase